MTAARSTRSRLFCSVLFEGFGELVIPRVPSASWTDERDRLVWSTIETLFAGKRPTNATAVSASLRRLNPWVVDYLEELVDFPPRADDVLPETLLAIRLHLLLVEKRKVAPRWIPLDPSPMWSKSERAFVVAKMLQLAAARDAEERR